MKREEKLAIIDSITEEINASNHLYFTDASTLNAQATSDLRRMCFERDIKLIVVKNTLLEKALEKAEGQYEEIYQVLKGHTAIMFSEHGNVPAKLIKEFRKKGFDKPLLKAAYVEESVYIGDDQLDALVNVKSKNELIGDVILLLQSPAKNVISALKSGGGKIAGILKTLSEKEG